MGERKTNEQNCSFQNFCSTRDEFKASTLPTPAPKPSSSSSVKSKRSTNIFSNLVRKAKRKKTPTRKDNEEVKSIHITQHDLNCESTVSLDLHFNETEIKSQNYESIGSQASNMVLKRSDARSATNISRHLMPLVTKNSSGPQDCSQTPENVFMQISASQKDLATNAVKTLTDGLEYVQGIVNNLQESENLIVGLLTKYIRDPNVQNQLVTAVSHHTKLQWDVERKSCSLANDMWIQQLEVGRAQEKILQETLNSIVKQNRHLQIESENLYRKHEKAMKILRGCTDNNRPRCQEHEAQIDAILRHNEKLQIKMEAAFKKFEGLEEELILYRQQNETMEQQLGNVNGNLMNVKALVHKMKTEYELELTVLNFKLDTKKHVIKEAFDVGDYISEDLNRLKNQLVNTHSNLDWSKMEVKGSFLTDLIHTCRNSINELSKEVLNLHTEITIKKKEIMDLCETKNKLQDNLKKSTTELDFMSKKMEENTAATSTRLSNEQTCQLLENEIKSYVKAIEQLKSENDKEKTARQQTIAELEMCQRQILEKEQLIDESKMYVATMSSENYSLKREIAILTRFFQEAGSGEAAEEIEKCRKELEYFHREVNKVQQENQLLMTQLGLAQNENGILLANQETANKTIQKQLGEIEAMSEEMHHLRQISNTEHETIISLQNERMRYLEEKSLLKTVVQHLRAELSKIKQLEEDLIDVTKQASKLGLVAEYNKQQGEKLKTEVRERDTLISQLKSSVHKLNELHMQNTKEKLSLCYELNEVCQLKEKLTEVLDTEVKKNEELGQSKEAIVKSVNSQIQKIEEKQKNERTAIRILLKDVKTLADEKEELVKENEKFQLEINESYEKISLLEKNLNEINQENSAKKEELLKIQKDYDILKKSKEDLCEQLEKEQSKYNTNVQHLRTLIEQLRKEKTDLQSQCEHLESNAEKIKQDLVVSRENEKTTKDLLNKTKRQQDDMEKTISRQAESIENQTIKQKNILEEQTKLIEEKENLSKEIKYLNTIIEQIVNDFEKNIKTTEEKQQQFDHDLEDLKQIIKKQEHEIEDLNRTIALKKSQIEEFKDMTKGENFHQKKCIELKQEIETFEKNYAKLKEINNHLENELSELQDEYDKCTNHIKNVEKEANMLEMQIKNILEQKEEDYLFYKKHIAELLRAREEIELKNQTEIQTLRQQLHEVNNKIVNEQSAYETLSQIHKEVSGKFMRSIKDLVEVKNTKQEIMDRLRHNQETIEKLEAEKNQLTKRLSRTVDDLEKAKQDVVQLNEENDLLKRSYNKALDKCVALEHQVKQLEIQHNQEIKDSDTAYEEKGDLQQEIENSKKELEETGSTIHRLKLKITSLEQEITLLQIERSELTMKLHETKKKLDTEKNLSEQLKNTHKLLLASVLQLKEEGKVDPVDCTHLLHMVGSTAPGTSEVASQKFKSEASNGMIRVL